MSGIENSQWVATVNEDNLLLKNGVAVMGTEFVYLIPVSPERLAEIKRDGVTVGDMLVSTEPPTFGALSVNKLLMFAINRGLFQEPKTKAERPEG